MKKEVFKLGKEVKNSTLLLTIVIVAVIILLVAGGLILKVRRGRPNREGTQGFTTELDEEGEYLMEITTYFMQLDPTLTEFNFPLPVISNLGPSFERTNTTFGWEIIKKGKDMISYGDFSLGERNIILINSGEELIFGMMYYFGKSLFDNLPMEVKKEIQLYDCPLFNTSIGVINTTDNGVRLLGVETVYNPTKDVTSQVILTKEDFVEKYDLNKIFDMIKQMKCEKVEGFEPNLE